MKIIENFQISTCLKKKMVSLKIRVTFNAETISRIAPNGGTQVFPNPGEPSPPGVGQVTTGRYVVAANLLGVIGDYVYTRTNVYADDQGRVHGDGIITYNLAHLGFRIKATSTYTIRTTDPAVPFSVDQFLSPINYVTFNGIPTQATVELTPVRGGASYRAVFSIRLLPAILELAGGLLKTKVGEDVDAETELAMEEEGVASETIPSSSSDGAPCQVVSDETGEATPCPW